MAQAGVTSGPGGFEVGRDKHCWMGSAPQALACVAAATAPGLSRPPCRPPCSLAHSADVHVELPKTSDDTVRVDVTAHTSGEAGPPSQPHSNPLPRLAHHPPHVALPPAGSLPEQPFRVTGTPPAGSAWPALVRTTYSLKTSYSSSQYPFGTWFSYTFAPGEYEPDVEYCWVAELLGAGGDVQLTSPTKCMVTPRWEGRCRGRGWRAVESAAPRAFCGRPRVHAAHNATPCLQCLTAQRQQRSLARCALREAAPPTHHTI